MVSYYGSTSRLIPMERQKNPRVSKTILKNNKVGWLTLPDFKTYYKSTIINTAWCWWKNTHKDQWNRNKSPEIGLHKYCQLIFFFIKVQTNSMEKEVFSIYSKIWTQTQTLPPYPKINLKWIIDLNVKCKTIKLPKETWDKIYTILGLMMNF